MSKNQNILFVAFMVSNFYVQIKAEETTTNVTNCYLCSIEGTDTILRCSSIIIDDAEMLNFNCILDHQKPFITTLIIENSTIPTLNFSFIKENGLSGLSEMSFYDCTITNVTGNIPCHVSELRLSNNAIRNFTAVLENTVEDATVDDDTFETIDIDDDGHLTTASSRPDLTNCTVGDVSLTLTNNLLEELPVEIVASVRLKALHLSGNPLKCEFIWETVWDHLSCQNRSMECREIFADQNVTTCQFYRQKLVPSGIFYYNLTQIFDSKIILENECSDMNRTCTCHPFNLLRGENGKPTVYLTVNCFGKNLTELPRVSPYTWELNVSSNHIQFLSSLNSSMYRNLRRLDIRNNLVDSLDDLTNSVFMKKFDLLYISANKFEKIPDSFLSKVKHSEGKGMLKIGSQLECNCLTATHTKGRLIEIQSNILDISDVICGNIIQNINVDKNEEADEHAIRNVTTEIFLRVKDLKITDVCSLSDEDDAFNWVLWIIVIEVICIAGVILKVFYDWRQYQRTGILPWIAEKLPRLPCDGILE